MVDSHRYPSSKVERHTRPHPTWSTTTAATAPTRQAATSLTPAAVIETGKWHPRYATVRAIHIVADIAIALVDSNSDGREIEQERYRWDKDRWRLEASEGLPFVEVGVTIIGEHRNANEPLSYRYAVGRAARSGANTYTLFGSAVQVHANEDGWWIHIEVPQSGQPPWPRLTAEQVLHELEQ